MKKASQEQSACDEYPDVDCSKWCGPTFQCFFESTNARQVPAVRGNRLYRKSSSNAARKSPSLSQKWSKRGLEDLPMQMNAQADAQEKGLETAIELGALRLWAIPIQIVYSDGKLEISTSHLRHGLGVSRSKATTKASVRAGAFDFLEVDYGIRTKRQNLLARLPGTPAPVRQLHADEQRAVP